MILEIDKKICTFQIIDLVLDASPPNSTSQQQIEYQTEVLTTLMENLLNTELFGSESNISNVCYLAARLVDKLWQGQLSRDPHEVSFMIRTYWKWYLLIVLYRNNILMLLLFFYYTSIGNIYKMHTVGHIHNLYLLDGATSISFLHEAMFGSLSLTVVS